MYLLGILYKITIISKNLVFNYRKLGYTQNNMSFNNI